MTCTCRTANDSPGYLHTQLCAISNVFITKDSGERQVYSTGMQRDSAAKSLRPDLVDQAMLRRWAELMGRGALKYGERNWEKAATLEELARFKASAYRHFFQWVNGDIDEDHGAAVYFNIAGAEMVKGKLNGNAKPASIDRDFQPDPNISPCGGRNK